jgi:hypothetical protein
MFALESYAAIVRTPSSGRIARRLSIIGESAATTLGVHASIDIVVFAEAVAT